MVFYILNPNMFNVSALSLYAFYFHGITLTIYLNAVGSPGFGSV